jgi:hypothetical protein
MTPKIKKLQDDLASIDKQIPLLVRHRAELLDALVMAEELEASVQKWKPVNGIPIDMSSEIRKLHAYVAEFRLQKPFNPREQNWYVEFNYPHNEWQMASHYNVRIPGVVYMGYGAARELARKLNTGEVEL